MDSLQAQMLCDAVVMGALCIARYVYGVECFEWYSPEWLTRWLEPADLTGSDTILGVED